MIKLELTDAQLSIVSQALVALPYHAVAALIGEINRQITAQRAAPEKPRKRSPRNKGGS